ALALARAHGAELVLMHVVEGVGGQWHGEQTADEEGREDERYVRNLTDRLNAHAEAEGRGRVYGVLGHGGVVAELVRLSKLQGIDLLVLGGHGHGAVGDIFRGQTI